MAFIGVNRENANGVFRFPANLMIGKKRFLMNLRSSHQLNEGIMRQFVGLIRIFITMHHHLSV